MKRILIMGLPGSGKTMLAKELQDKLNCPWFNADVVREQFNDWDFSPEGRIRQAHRMRTLADTCPNDPKYVICEFVCPLPEMREIFDADYTVWVDTENEGRFDNTNNVFQPPIDYDYRVVTKECKKWSTVLANKIKDI